MKTFKQLTDADKATTLHQWFPQETKQILVFMQSTAQLIAQGTHHFDEKAIQRMFTNRYVKRVAVKIAQQVSTFFNEYVRNASFFAGHLFTADQIGTFTKDCIIQYARICPNNKLRDCVQLFFVDTSIPPARTRKQKGGK